MRILVFLARAFHNFRHESLEVSYNSHSAGIGEIIFVLHDVPLANISKTKHSFGSLLPRKLVPKLKKLERNGLLPI